MQRIAGMTVTVKADGVPEAIYNGQRDRVVESIRQEMAQQKQHMEAELERMKREATEEHKRMEAELEVERDRADIQTRERNRLLRNQLAVLTAKPIRRRRSLLYRVRDAIVMAWAYVYAITIGGVWIEMGERLGLWERIEEE